MKHRLLLLLPAFLFVCSNLFGQVQIKAGLGLGYASEEFADLGIRVNGVADITEEWSGATNVTFWFTDADNVSFTTINLDGHYNFYPGSDNLKLYPLLGLNFSIISYDFDSPFIDNQSDTEVGLNIGGGTEIMFSDKISGFGEIKYIISDADQLIIAIGAMYTIVSN